MDPQLVTCNKFLPRYLRVRDYVAPTNDGARFQLRSLAARTGIRNAFIALGISPYIFLVLAAIWLGLNLTSKVVASDSWSGVLGALCVCAVLAASGGWFLREASLIYWAAKLAMTQEPENLILALGGNSALDPAPHLIRLQQGID